jgi:hypothetical protein
MFNEVIEISWFSRAVADVYLYPTGEGGKTLTVLPGWGCPCSCSKSSDSLFYDGWPLLNAPITPGERRRLGFVFVSSNDAAVVPRNIPARVF